MLTAPVRLDLLYAQSSSSMLFHFTVMSQEGPQQGFRWVSTTKPLLC